MTNEEMTLTTTEVAGLSIEENPTGIWMDKAKFDQALRASTMLSKSGIIPQAYQNKPQDCFVALEIANRLQLPPLFVMQNLYVVQGKPSWSGQACTALIQSSGLFRDVRHNYVGEKGTDERGCYVSAIRCSDGETVEGTEVNIAMAKGEGWYQKSGSKWKTMPDLMLAYRSSAFFARVHCPAVMMGIYTQDEISDISPARTPKAKSKEANALSEALKGGGN